MMSDDKILIDDKFAAIGRKLLKVERLPFGTYQRYLRSVNGPEEGDRIYEAEIAAERVLDEEFPIQFRGTFFAGPKVLIDVFKRTGHPWQCTEQARGGYDYYGPFYFNDITVDKALSMIVTENHWQEEQLAKMMEVYEAEKGPES